MRKSVIAGNWKMNTDATSGAELASAVVDGIHGMILPPEVDVVVCPPLPLLPIVYARLGGSRVKLGAQNVHSKKSGAYTGEASAPMLVSVGCTHVIVGHSERRLMFAESDGEIGYKANAVVDAGLAPIICVGETEAERESGMLHQVLERQIRAAFDGIFDFNVGVCLVAYEPVWAIGTGRTATPEQAQEAHIFIRDVVGRIYGAPHADAMPILYGGSVRADSASALFAQLDIDGALVGGASLKANEFLAIVKAATTAVAGASVG